MIIENVNIGLNIKNEQIKIGDVVYCTDFEIESNLFLISRIEKIKMKLSALNSQENSEQNSFSTSYIFYNELDDIIHQSHIKAVNKAFILDKGQMLVEYANKEHQRLKAIIQKVK